MKIQSDKVLHKKLNGVFLNINSEKDVKFTFDKIIKNVKKFIPENEIEGINVQKMKIGKIELILGLHNDQYLELL